MVLVDRQSTSVDRAQRVFSGESVRSEIQHAPVTFVTGHPVDLTAALRPSANVLVNQ